MLFNSRDTSHIQCLAGMVIVSLLPTFVAWLYLIRYNHSYEANLIRMDPFSSRVPMSNIHFWSAQYRDMMVHRSELHVKRLGLISAREKLAVCDVTNLPYMDVNWQSISIYDYFVACHWPPTIRVRILDLMYWYIRCHEPVLCVPVTYPNSGFLTTATVVCKIPKIACDPTQISSLIIVMPNTFIHTAGGGSWVSLIPIFSLIILGKGIEHGKSKHDTSRVNCICKIVID